jgi:hypothetical protein
MNLKSAEKARSLEVAKRIVLVRRVSESENNVWDQVKEWSRLLAELIEVPEVVKVLAREKYRARSNDQWLVSAVRDFETLSLGKLMTLYHGRKKDWTSTTTAFLAELTGKEGEDNPAYILDELNLWDKCCGKSIVICNRTIVNAYYHVDPLLFMLDSI